MEKIQQYTKNKISLLDLREFYGISEYSDLVQLVARLIEIEQITPIKTSKLNGKKPALFNGYRILRPAEDYSAEKKELMYLCSQLNIDYYMKHLEQYQKDRKYVLMLDGFMKKNKENLTEAVSGNERSFEIFGREKFISKEGGQRILSNLGVSLEQLNVYKTTEPLAYYTNHKRQPQKLLIIENKDTFYSMRKHLIDKNQTIFNEEIGTLIYGGGKAIYRSFEDFGLCVEPYMNDPNNTFLYFGDLDYEGILIYEKLQQMVGQDKVIKPFIPAYERMLIKGGRLNHPENGEMTSIRYELPEMKSGQNQNCGDLFYSYFNEKVQKIMKELLAENRYIPQEILQEKDFSQNKYCYHKPS